MLKINKIVASQWTLAALLVSFLYFAMVTTATANLAPPTFLYLFYILCYFLFAKNIYYEIIHDKYLLLLTLLIVAITVISSFFRKAGALMPLCMFVLQLLIAPQFVMTKRMKLVVISIFVAFSLYFFLINKSSINTNSIGFIWTVCGVYLLIFVHPKTILSYLYYFAVLSFIIPNLLVSNSRSCLLGFLFFMLCKFLGNKVFQSKLLYKILCILLTFGSILWVSLYVWMFITEFDLQQYTSLVSDDKSAFSGRQYIWNEALGMLAEKPFIGYGSDFVLESFEKNELHNSMLCLFVFYGCLVSIGLLLLLNRHLFSLFDFVKKNVLTRSALAAFFCFLIIGFFENTIVAHPICFLSLFIAFSVKNDVQSALKLQQL